MSSRQAKIQEDTTFRIMRILQESPDLSQRDLAERLGMSLGGLNYCLKALMDKGLVKLENFQNSQHKFKYVYVLTPAGIAQKMAMTGHFLKRKMDEYEALKAEIEAIKAEVKREAGVEGPLVVSCGNHRRQSVVVVAPCGHVGKSQSGLSTCPCGLVVHELEAVS